MVRSPRSRGENWANYAEHRSYRFAADDEVEEARHGVNIDTGLKQDFGPSLLMQVGESG